MKKVIIMLFSLMVVASLGSRAQTSSQKKEKSSTTTSAKAMTMAGTVSSDGTTLVADKDNKSWKIDNPEEVKAHQGHHVSVNATEDAATETIHVNSVKMLGKAKSGTPSSTGGEKKY